jgi:uncharacterized protein YcgI (DUF1989 family)
MSDGTSQQAIDVAAQSGGWIEAKQGDLIRIIDVEGSQVADAFAVSSADRSEWLSTANTRSGTLRLFPQLGETFLTNRFHPILTLAYDTSPGVHDMLFRACDPHMYEMLGVVGHHPNCHDNFLQAAGAAGWVPPEVPDPVNFFQNTPVSADGVLRAETALSKAGDAVTLRAEMDLVIVVTACSMDYPRINGERCTGIRVEILPGS